MMKMYKKPVVRMAPSPTGTLHIGTARTALFNFLFAKRYGGKFVMRIEDTDKERSKPEHEEDIISGLKWLGLEWDEFYRQSERGDIYEGHIQRLIDSGAAYISKEENSGEEGKRSEVIRFRNPGREVVFTDLVRGEIKFDTAELGDFVIAKSINEPLYHLAVVVDDMESGITHIIRGEDHISNTPRQILIQEALGADRPEYVHLPLILGPDRSKLSKRHGATALSSYQDRGFLPQTMTNYIAMLGWNPGVEKEIYSLEELQEIFNLEQIQKHGAIFNEEKLLWMQKEHLRSLPIALQTEYVLNAFAKSGKDVSAMTGDKGSITLSVTERYYTVQDIVEAAGAGEFDFFFGKPQYTGDILLWKKQEKGNALAALKKALEVIADAPSWEKGSLQELVMPAAEDFGRGNFLWPLRVALSGREKSPDPFTLLHIFGKEESLDRIGRAIAGLAE